MAQFFLQIQSISVYQMQKLNSHNGTGQRIEICTCKLISSARMGQRPLEKKSVKAEPRAGNCQKVKEQGKFFLLLVSGFCTSHFTKQILRRESMERSLQSSVATWIIYSGFNIDRNLYFCPWVLWILPVHCHWIDSWIYH